MINPPAIAQGLGATAALLAGLAGGGVLTGVGAYAWNVLIDNPGIVRVTRQIAEDACTIRTLDAAQRAEAKERDRLSRINADAITAWRQAFDTETRQRQAAETERDKERAAHEQALRESGLGRILTDADFDWLRRQPGPAAAGGGR